jgi:hypothetical protein
MPQPAKSKRIVRKKQPTKAPLKVVGGAKPTGKLPTVIGTGIFGLPGQTDGIFSMKADPIAAAGIFFNPYAVTNIAYQQPSSKWVLKRRPGQPLYPGSSARGIVLIGPSMGDDASGTIEVQRWKMYVWMALGLAGAYFLGKKAIDKVDQLSTGM